MDSLALLENMSQSSKGHIQVGSSPKSSKKNKTTTTENCHFTAVEYCCILHGNVCVLVVKLFQGNQIIRRSIDCLLATNTQSSYMTAPGDEPNDTVFYLCANSCIMCIQLGAFGLKQFL